MPTSLSTNANERSSYFITVTLVDEDATTIGIDRLISVHWTLTNAVGDVINSRERVALGTLANPFNIVLSGNDLLIEGNENEVRHLTIEAVYDSILADDMVLTDYASFTINNLVFLEGTYPTSSPSPSASASPSASPSAP